MFKLNKIIVVIGCLGLVSCMSESQLEDKMTKVLKDNPQIVIDSIKENPADYIMAIQDAAKNAQGAMNWYVFRYACSVQFCVWIDIFLNPMVRFCEEIRHVGTI